MDDKIMVFEDWYALSRSMPLRDFLVHASSKEVNNRGWRLPSFDTAQGSVNARINHGRWLADCPNDSCTNAILASKAQPFYVCIRCKGPAMHVVFPANAPEIEKELLRRPNTTNRNWHGQPVSELAEELARHGG